MILWRLKFGSFDAILRWVLMNSGQEIKESHAFETHLNFKSDFTGSLDRISVTISDGRWGGF